MDYPAHILCKAGQEVIQSVKTHLQNTASIASICLKEAGLQNAGFIAGIVHDVGKYSEEFKAYLKNAVSGNHVKRGSVNHTFAGVRMLIEEYHHSEDPDKVIISELLAWAAGSHHGTFDCIDPHGKNGFEHRLSEERKQTTKSIQRFFQDCINLKQLDQIFLAATSEIQSLFPLIGEYAGTQCEYDFSLSLLARLLLSAVIEGDRTDTAAFMDGNLLPDIWTAMNAQSHLDITQNVSIWEKPLQHLEDQLLHMPHDTLIQQARQTFSDMCSQAAKGKGGIFRLNLPTGSGKTLSALRFALTHALHHGKDRILFVAPLLTILDQNAKEIRKAIHNDALILEHHSNVIRDQESTEELQQYETLSESWSAPIIITTLVQFLNTLFSGKTSCIRRFHALCNSVIILDEVQSVPRHMLTLFNLAIEFLSHVCGSTIVLCSATQPALTRTERPLRLPQTDIVPHDPHLWKPFRRTEIIDQGQYRLEEVPSWLYEQMQYHDSLLVICNKKQQARDLYQRMKDSNVSIFHLSAAMHQAHREQTLDELKMALEHSRNGGPKVLCIATQLMEAGVDLSFACVVRFCAGLDSVIQSAGRCNRNGENPHAGQVYVLHISDENLNKLQDMRAEKTATEDLLVQYHMDPQIYDMDLTSDKAIESFYKRLYLKSHSCAQDFPVQLAGEKESKTIFSLLSDNTSFSQHASAADEVYYMKQAFRTAGNAFYVLEDSETLFVPWGEEGQRLYDYLLNCREPPDPQKLRQCQRYCVSIYTYEKKKLADQCLICPILDGAILVLVDPRAYDPHTGLSYISSGI